MANPNSSDPFEVLGLEPSPDLDKKQIKRAYKRMAVKYHPDVVVNKDSTPEEKKKASDLFAKINAAYETLMGNGGKSAGSSSSSSSSASGYGGYTPPHRRKTGSYASSASSSSYSSTDWRDYMPKYDDDEYDTDGDSFGAIFADLVKGAAAGAAMGGGNTVLKDFVEFLERNLDGYASGTGSDDAELAAILTTGSLEDVANEMDDTQLVVDQLTSKLDNVENEVIMLQAELKQTTRFVEKIDLEEKIAELEARKTVVKDYAQRARRRLVSLQTRYKELIVGGSRDVRSGGGGRPYDTSSSSSSSSYSSRSAPSYSTSSSPSPSPSPSSTASTPNQEDDGEAWKNQGFGSSGRGRGSSRRRRNSTVREPATSSYSSPARPTPPQSPPRRQPNPPSSQETRTSSPSSSTLRRPATSAPTEWVPPHRRSSGFDDRAQEDKRRLRELQVDDEFDKLKKELGL